MKLKYYLRGLGTGIAVTALIIGISSGVSDKNVMTDEEVLARAKQLGSVERTVLSDMVKDTEVSETEKRVESEPQETTEEVADEENEETKVVTEEEIVDSEQEEISMMTEDPENDNLTEDESDTTENNKNTEEFGMPDEAGTITIKIVRGDSSDSVSRMLEEAGLVDNATAYDKYLCQNGYDKSIRIGNFELPADATGEEIAKLITGR